MFWGFGPLRLNLAERHAQQLKQRTPALQCREGGFPSAARYMIYVYIYMYIYVYTYTQGF